MTSTRPPLSRRQLLVRGHGQNFLGQADWDPGLGLDANAFANVISQVGNYQEIYERHVTPLGLPLEGSVNDLWSNGGLMYVPPFR